MIVLAIGGFASVDTVTRFDLTEFRSGDVFVFAEHTIGAGSYQ
ncbi:hypothetical protein ACFL04_00765 [Patescibacteria group bacterium]